MKTSFLVIDAGNTSLKFAYFLGNELQITGKGFSDLKQLVKNQLIENAIISSVALDEITEKIKQLLPGAILMSDQLISPLKNNYEFPEKLGVDRLANAVAGHFLHPNKAVLIVDVGTCLKFDLVDENGIYQGGSISPGIQLRFKSLNEHTAKLPLIELKQNEKPSIIPLVGRNTTDSILSGVINGMHSEIFQLIQRYQQNYKELFVFLTGGDAKMFDLDRKNGIFAHENLTLLGLKLMLEQNV